MKIVFDLDGVLRDLNGYLNTKYGIPYPQEWFWKHDEKNIFDWVEKDNYATLVYAPATEYERIAKFCFLEQNIELWTCQPDNWKPYTKLWIDLHFPNAVVHYLNTAEKRARLDNEHSTYLVEDCPLFSHWERIILIDQPYNKNVKCETRIKKPEELMDFISERMDYHASI